MSARPHPKRRQAGLTLIELLVAITLGILVAGAAVATLLIARQGFGSADASSQLRENARYAAGLIERVAVEAGFVNAAYNDFYDTTQPKPPGLQGYDNALVSPALSTLPTGLAHGTRTTANCGSATSTQCPTNQSDVLVVRFKGASRPATPASADQSMINCAGIAEPEFGAGANPVDPRAWSIFHVATGPTAETNAEPALACTYRDPDTGTFRTRSIVKGVESFQVMYGAFGVTPNVCSAPMVAATAASTAANFAAQAAGGRDAPARFYTARQLDDAAGNYCANNWARVRALRIGLLVRGDAGTAVSRVAQTFNVLGKLASTDGVVGSTLTTPADGRLRQQLVFTIYLRNAQF